MSSARGTGFVVLTLIILVCSAAPFSFAQGQRLDDLNLMAQANLSGTPMLGVEYAVTDQASVRLAVGYFQYDEDYSPCTDEYTSAYPVACPLVRYHATTHQYSGSIAGLYRLIEESGVSPYAGVELQLVYARAPNRRQWINIGWTDPFRLIGHSPIETVPAEGRQYTSDFRGSLPLDAR